VSDNALIITDGSESIQSVAKLITESMSGYKVKICPAHEFEGVNLLSAGVFFIGCENSRPESFAYLEKLLLHINLASRKCGVFSVKEKTVNYLCKLLKDCDASLGEPLVAANIKKSEIKKWIKGILKK